MNIHKDSDTKEKIDTLFKRIANTVMLNASFTDNLGLLNGKMGIAIFFYHYFRYSGNNIYEEYAGGLIDEIYSEININTQVDLADGFTGIGWGVEYLVNNGFVQADTDEALSEIDAAVYRIRLNTPVLVNPNDNFFSYGHYYISRLGGHKIDDADLNTLIRKYHLIFMIDECERIIINKHYLINGLEALNADQLNSILWFIRKADRLGIFPVKTRRILDNIPDHNLKSYCDSMNMKVPGITSDQFSENDLNIFIKRSWQRLIYQDYTTANYPDINKLLLYISDEENWKSRLNNLKKDNLGLSGLAGLGLGLLFFLSDSKPCVTSSISENVR